MLGANFGNGLLRRKWNSNNVNGLGNWTLQRKTIIVSVSSTTKVKAPIEVASKDGELRVFIVAGEVSGDSIASRLMASLKILSPLPVRFAGVGGICCIAMIYATQIIKAILLLHFIKPKMSRQGFQSLFPIEDIAVMGIWELLPHLYKIKVKLKETVDAAALFEPHVVLTIDSKGFSFRFLKQLRARYIQQKLQSPVHFHYVAPSFWAWKGGESRLGGLAEFVDHLLCILPHEDEICRLNGLAATFVGHPVLEDVLELNSQKNCSVHEWRAEGNGEGFRSKHEVPSGSIVISLLPGSRVQEVTRMLPIFSNTMELLKEIYPQLMTIIHVAPNQHVEDFIVGAVKQWPVPSILIPGGSTDQKYDALSASRVALCTSGTVAVEMQLARLPCVVAYRAHILTECLIEYKAKIQYISLPNILLDSPIIPEALFQSCTPANLVSLLKDLINDNGSRDKQIVAAEKVVKLLHPPSERIIHNLPEQILTKTYPDNTPSVVAALTILNYGKS